LKREKKAAKKKIKENRGTLAKKKKGGFGHRGKKINANRVHPFAL